MAHRVRVCAQRKVVEVGGPILPSSFWRNESKKDVIQKFKTTRSRSTREKIVQNDFHSDLVGTSIVNVKKTWTWRLSDVFEDWIKIWEINRIVEEIKRLLAWILLECEGDMSCESTETGQTLIFGHVLIGGWMWQRDWTSVALIPFLTSRLCQFFGR